jgi:hypothetical protein
VKRITLREVAHARSGEKGRGSNITVIAYDLKDYGLLREQVTVEAVRGLYGPITKGSITRYEAPAIGALSFVLEDVLEGGRTRTLAFEESGKALSSLILTLPVSVPDDYVERVKRPTNPLVQPPLKSNAGKKIRIGAATAWSRDRFEPAEDLIARGNIQYLGFDAMSEVTMSALQMARMENDKLPPFDPNLESRMEPLLKLCKEKGIKLITNSGWLDPVAAADHILQLARRLGMADLKVAAVCGGVLTDRIADMGLNFIETGTPIADHKNDIVCAEAYMGAQGIIDALKQGADVVITTRVADACIYLAPLAYEFGWDLNDPHLAAKGMIIGHLMECGAQVCGGYFADPGYKDVPRLEDLGNPIVEVTAERVTMSKLPGSGGLMTEATCKEQLLYEVQNPARYLCPDVIADLTKVSFRQIAEDEVEVLIDAAGLPRTPTLKVLVGLKEGFMTEEMVIFAGPGALNRAEMTKDILQKRFAKVALKAEEIRWDYLGINAVHRESSPAMPADPYEVILRVAVKAKEKREAEKLRREIDPLAVNGTAGTGKWGTSIPGSRVYPVIGLNSVLVPREVAPVSVVMRELGPASKVA